MSIHIGPLVFDHADDDAESDCSTVGLTVIGARELLDRDGRLVVTIPETVEANADEFAGALRAA